MEHKIVYIIRSKRPDTGWTDISQTVFQAEISGEALGVLCYLLSRPETWVVRLSHLQKRFGRSKSKMQAIIRELMAAGFIHREPGRLFRGRWATPKYTVTDQPQSILRAAVDWTAY